MARTVPTSILPRFDMFALQYLTFAPWPTLEELFVSNRLEPSGVAADDHNIGGSIKLIDQIGHGVRPARLRSDSVQRLLSTYTNHQFR